MIFSHNLEGRKANLQQEGEKYKRKHNFLLLELKNKSLTPLKIINNKIVRPILILGLLFF